MANEHGSEPVRTQVEAIYHLEARRIFATLVRLLGGFDLAEYALAVLAGQLDQDAEESLGLRRVHLLTLSASIALAQSPL